MRLPSIEPTLTFPPELLLAARGTGSGIRAAIFDVDGVLTDGSIYMNEHGEVLKAFSTLDGHGLKLLARGGIAGIFTDGDLRRLIETGADLRGLTASEVMHGRPRLIRAEALAVEAADLMEQHRITGLIVVDAEGGLAGVLNSNDLMRAKVI